MVMCDEGYADTIKGFPIQHIHITPPNPSVIHVSMRKTEIFSFSKIHEYEKVLYLDCDIVVCGSLNYVLDSVTRDDVLYVVPENNDHTSVYFQMKDKPYDVNTLNYFERNNIHTFNCGQFAFKVSDVMKTHFNDITNQIHTSYDPYLHFYEQCFMNNHFNRLGAVSYDIASHVNLLPASQPLSKELRTINHIFVASVHYMIKLYRMKQCHQARIEIDNPNMCELRLDGKPSIAEIGMFRGEFSKSLIKMYDPGVFYVIDPREGQIDSGDDAVSLRKSREDIPPKSIDLMYINDDHSYDGVSMDLKLGLALIKSRGFICGRDYEYNNHVFSVKQTVKEFCVEHGYRIMLFTMDRCVSFAIRIS
jgi:hypothetical protein